MIKDSTSGVEHICAGANREQLRVITETDNNILLIASAGTGKTDSLARRVSYLLETNVATPEEILCLTFTNKACGEMKGRIQNMIGKVAQQVDVMTIHAFCHKVLVEESKSSDSLYVERYIFDEEDCEELWQDLKPQGMNRYAFQNWLQLVKEHRALYHYYTGVEEEDYRRTLTRLYREKQQEIQKLFQNQQKFDASLCMSMMEAGAKLILTYNQKLQSAGGYDFTDLLIGVYELFQDSRISQKWRKHYRYFCIDEMQDTGELEYALLKIIWEGNQVLLCGDYFQTIYEWRGSNPVTTLADYRENFQPKTIVFYENYRANKTLFEATFTTLLALFPEEVKDVYDRLPQAHSSKEGMPIKVCSTKSTYEEARYVFQKILEMPIDLAKEVGILVRNNKQAQQISEYIKTFNEKLPQDEQRNFMIIDETKFFRRQEIKDVLAFFKLLLNPFDRGSAKRIMRRFVTGIGEARIKELDSIDVRKVGLQLTDFLDMNIFTEEPYEQLESAIQHQNIIVFDVESTGVDTLHDEIIQIAALRIDAQGEVIAKFERFIAPQKSVGSSEEVHGFSDAWLQEHGEEAAIVLEDFWKFTEGATIVGHNVNYDISIFTAELQRHHLPAPKFSGVYDTLDIYRRFYPNLINHKLGYLSEIFKTKHKPSHNAMDDILATAELLILALEENIIPTKDKRRQYIMQYKSYFAQYASAFSTVKRMAQMDAAKDVLTYIMKNLGVADYYARQVEGQKRIDYIRDFYRMLAGREEDPAYQKGLQELGEIIRLAALTSGEPDPRLKNRTSIPIITVHQAKGSEFSYVFLMGLNEGEFPSWLAIRDGNEDEEKRLFYVALTRAKKELVITYAAQDGYKKSLRPSPLLAYLPKNTIYESIQSDR